MTTFPVTANAVASELIDELRPSTSAMIALWLAAAASMALTALTAVLLAKQADLITALLFPAGIV